MVFAVSTLGCPGLPLAQVAALVRPYAIELRCAEDEPVHVGISKAARRDARQLLADEGVTLVSLATYVKLADGARGLDAHLELAHDLGAPALRLFPGEREPRALDLPVDQGVRLLVETHDACLRGSELRPWLVENPGLGAVWDAVHPWRAGETPAETAEALRPWLAEVQIKDVASMDDLTPVVPGTGVVPLREVLAEVGDDVPVVLEHEARWYAGAAPIAAAIAGAVEVLRSSARL
ncbi:sugar phosphate isomerase/epimerase family protein [Paractinoplanes globisporus]|uniref:Sugar phosphate isomerase/epimerase family protein n=1 Tax=Paractinoplanes globisporus TaxID=113565 RepID=A0ABW6WW55_9ACTN|nr:TIM barrel protein [Actinoplanes globisporus]